jgi:hypothetical protein
LLAPFTHFDIHHETELHCELCKHWGDSDKDKSNDSKGITIVNDIGGRRFPTTTLKFRSLSLRHNCSLQNTINFSTRRSVPWPYWKNIMEEVVPMMAWTFLNKTDETIVTVTDKSRKWKFKAEIPSYCAGIHRIFIIKLCFPYHCLFLYYYNYW